MALMDVVIVGTIKADGTLELDEKLSISPGRVQVTVRPLVTSRTGRGLVDVMDEIRSSQRARGYMGRTMQQLHAEDMSRQQEDAEYEQRCETLWGGPLPPAKP